MPPPPTEIGLKDGQKASLLARLSIVERTRLFVDTVIIVARFHDVKDFQPIASFCQSLKTFISEFKVFEM